MFRIRLRSYWLEEKKNCSERAAAFPLRPAQTAVRNAIYEIRGISCEGGLRSASDSSAYTMSDCSSSAHKSSLSFVDSLSSFLAQIFHYLLCSCIYKSKTTSVLKIAVYQQVIHPFIHSQPVILCIYTGIESPSKETEFGTGMSEANFPIEVDDMIVLLLGAPSANPNLQGKMKGITRLEKLMFLVERETEIKEILSEDMEFSAHNFGPFSSKIYQAIDVLASAELVLDSSAFADTQEDTWESQDVIGKAVGDPYATRDIELTDRGRKYYKALVEELGLGVEEELSSFKKRFGGLPLRQLVRYVYKAYPDYTENSIIKDEILS